MGTKVMPSEEMESLRAYVMAPGSQNQADSTVRLQVTHSNLQARFMEIRLDLHMSVEAVKVKLSFHCGTSPSAMVLSLLDENGTMLYTLWEDHRKLGYYSPRDGYALHIVDSDPTSASAGGWLENTALVEKYKMSDEDYSKRENTYRRWKETKLAEDPTWTLERDMAKRRGQELPPPPPKVDDPEHQADLAAGIQPGQRCSVDPGDRRGEVKFVGKVEGLPMGWWVGVHYDEPLGKNDGSVKGKKIFECPTGYGAFVRPDKVKVGDFPAIDEFAEEQDAGLGDDEI